MGYRVRDSFKIVEDDFSALLLSAVRPACVLWQEKRIITAHERMNLAAQQSASGVFGGAFVSCEQAELNRAQGFHPYMDICLGSVWSKNPLSGFPKTGRLSVWVTKNFSGFSGGGILSPSMGMKVIYTSSDERVVFVDSPLGVTWKCSLFSQLHDLYYPYWEGVLGLEEAISSLRELEERSLKIGMPGDFKDMIARRSKIFHESLDQNGRAHGTIGGWGMPRGGEKWRDVAEILGVSSVVPIASFNGAYILGDGTIEMVLLADPLKIERGDFTSIYLDIAF